MEAAERLGVSKRRLEGWEPTTFYETDAAGRVVSSTPEPEWDVEQRGWMLALAVYRAKRCPVCGGDLDECGPASRGKWTVPAPRRCHRADAIMTAQEGRSKTQRPQALMWNAERKT